MNPERIGVGILVAILVASFWFLGANPRSVANENTVPTTSKLGWVAPPDAASSSVKFHTTKSIPAGSTFVLDLRDNNLYERKEQTQQRAELGLDVSVVRNRAFFDPAYGFPFTDFGPFAGIKSGDRPPPGFAGYDDFTRVVGLRTSPVRLLYGTVAPDFLVAPHYFGVGVSAYLPPDLVGPAFRHWGVGYGHLYGFDTRASGNILYLSFTTKVP